MCRDYGASSNVSKIHGPGSRPSIQHPAFSWRRQGASRGERLRWAHKVDRALRPVRRGGSSMLNQMPKAHSCHRGAWIPPRATLPCAKVQVWPRKVRGILSSNALRDRVPPLHERQLRSWIYLRQVFFPDVSPGWRRCRKPDPRLNPRFNRRYCQEITSSEFVNLPSPLFPSFVSVPRDHAITPWRRGLGPAPLLFP